MRIYTVLVVLLIIVGCQKSGTRQAPAVSLTGRWKYIEHYMSSGGPGSWFPAPANQWLELDQNGGISSNVQEFTGATAYQLLDSANLKIMQPAAANGFLTYYFKIDTAQAILIMSPTNPMCIEGCSLKFRQDNLRY